MNKRKMLLAMVLMLLLADCRNLTEKIPETTELGHGENVATEINTAETEILEAESVEAELGTVGSVMTEPVQDTKEEISNHNTETIETANTIPEETEPQETEKPNIQNPETQPPTEGGNGAMGGETDEEFG